MKVVDTALNGVLLIETAIFYDERGFFREVYHKEKLKNIGINGEFVQNNLSCSSKNVLRGMHHQSVSPQGKLVKVIKGSVYDVAVDIRLNSPTYGKWYGQVLSQENGRMLYIPADFAHGFLSLEDDTYMHYNCTRSYEPLSQVTIQWNDSVVDINWGKYLNGEPTINEKDKEGLSLSDFHTTQNNF